MTRTGLLGVALACATAITCTALVTAGPIDPPAGPVASTYKTLTEVEPRIALSDTNTPGDADNTYIISAPGSYYLTATLAGEADKHAISIQADGVTLDLNGFEVIGGGGATRGVNVPGTQQNFTIRNGTIRGWIDGGVRADLVVTTLAEGLRLIDNIGGPGLAMGLGSATGCIATGNSTGFTLGLGAALTNCNASSNTIGFESGDRVTLNNCVATTNTAEGFRCGSYVSILDCTAGRNGATGILVLGSSTIARCTSTRNIPLGGSPGGTGIWAGPGCTITDSTASNNAGRGILAGSGCTITDSTANFNTLGGIVMAAGSSGGTIQRCTAQGNLVVGIQVEQSALVMDNSCDANTRGIIAAGDGNRIDGNSCAGNTFTGYSMDGAGNLMIRNTARGNGANFAAGALSIRGLILINTPGSTISSPSPWSNIEY